MKAKRNRQRYKADRREPGNGNTRILLLTYVFFGIFLAMCIYLVNFTMFKGSKIINNSRNPRQDLLAQKVVKGDILSREGKKLATTVKYKNGKEKRTYPFGKTFCHVVGRTSNSLTGIELNKCYPMLTSHQKPWIKLANTFKGEKSQGDSVVTTLDASLQKRTYEAMSGYKGAAVAVEPSTGKVLAMVSTPAYDPNKADENWENLINVPNEESKLINRATQGLYTPGSIFKIVTAMEYLNENDDNYDGFSYRCKGSDTFGGNKINCYSGQVHGKMDMKEAFAKSCNGAFGKIGVELNAVSWGKLCEKLYISRKIPFELERGKGEFSLSKYADDALKAQTGIGQGDTLVTPLQSALLAATVANKGEMMKPYVVDSIQDAAYNVVEEYNPESLGKVIDEDIAESLKEMMKAVVTDGTGRGLGDLGVEVAGKTGSPEVDSKKTTNACFVGFAPADKPRIAVAVMVEGEGTGSKYAVPVAKKMFEEYLE